MINISDILIPILLLALTAIATLSLHALKQIKSDLTNTNKTLINHITNYKIHSTLAARHIQ